MNYPTIEAKEYAQRVEAIRAKMNENGVDLLVAFSNLLEIFMGNFLRKSGQK